MQKIMAPLKSAWTQSESTVNLLGDNTLDSHSEGDAEEAKPMGVDTGRKQHSSSGTLLSTHDIDGSQDNDKMAEGKAHNPTPTQQIPMKRRCATQDPAPEMASGFSMEAMFVHMKNSAERAAAESVKKDAMIASLQSTIASLQEEIKALRVSFAAITNHGQDQ